MNKLLIENISKYYGKKPVLRGISINLSMGEVVALFGPNGAGKTTCFSIIAGLIKADSGKLILNDKDITNLPMYLRAKMGLGYLPQEASIFRGLTVFENLKAIVEITENNKKLVERRVEELLEDFSISHLKNVDSVSLSGGERRRLEIARSLASNPKFLMLDEPFAGIDPLAIIDIKYLITLLKKRNIGILITEHNVRETLDIVDRAYIIYDGKVLADGKAQEIVNNDRVRSVYLGYSFDSSFI